MVIGIAWGNAPSCNMTSVIWAHGCDRDSDVDGSAVSLQLQQTLVSQSRLSDNLCWQLLEHGQLARPVIDCDGSPSCEYCNSTFRDLPAAPLPWPTRELPPQHHPSQLTHLAEWTTAHHL